MSSDTIPNTDHAERCPHGFDVHDDCEACDVQGFGPDGPPPARDLDAVEPTTLVACSAEGCPITPETQRCDRCSVVAAPAPLPKHFHCGVGRWTCSDECDGCGRCMMTGTPAGECTAEAYDERDRCPVCDDWVGHCNRTGFHHRGLGGVQVALKVDDSKFRDGVTKIHLLLDGLAPVVAAESAELVAAIRAALREVDRLQAQVADLTATLDGAVDLRKSIEREREEARYQVDALTQQVADLEARAIPTEWTDDVEIHRGGDLGDEETIVAGPSGATWRKMSGYASADGYPRRFPTLSAALNAAKDAP